MNDQNNIQDELKDLGSSLPANGGLTPFSAPEGYFDELAERILAIAKAQDGPAAGELQALSPLLASLSKVPPYTVPAGYFDDNAARLPFLLNEEESPVLAAIGKTMPYTVPQGYFETLPQQVMAKLAPPKARVVPFFSRTWAKVAVAATIAGVVFLGGYRLLNDKSQPAPAATAQLPVDTASSGKVAQSEGSVLQYIQAASTEELDAFMKAVPVNPAETQRAALQPGEKKEMREWLKNVSERDIDAFLNELPTADEDLLVID